MASKRRLRQKQCGDKKAYRSYDKALADRWPDRFELMPYGCRFCGKIHLGHPTAGAKKGMAARSAERRRKA